MTERPIDPPEGEFEPIEISDLDLMDQAEKELDDRLKNGGLCEVIDEITHNFNDMNEFEANLWAYLKENDKAMKFICRKYVFDNSEQMESTLQQISINERTALRDNPENI